jgi:hypothetical protein
MDTIRIDKAIMALLLLELKKKVFHGKFVTFYLVFLICPDLILFKYSFKSIFTSPDKINNPKILGNAIAKIIISEKSKTAPSFTEDPMIIKIKNISL